MMSENHDLQKDFYGRFYPTEPLPARWNPTHCGHSPSGGISGDGMQVKHKSVPEKAE